MSRPGSGSLDAIALAGGVRAFQLRFTIAGRRERVILHETPACTCGCGGGWDERAARNELGKGLSDEVCVVVVIDRRAGCWAGRDGSPGGASVSTGPAAGPGEEPSP